MSESEEKPPAIAGGFGDLQALLAAVVESSDDAIFSKDRDAIIQSWNRGAQRLYGYTAEEMIGRSVATIVPSDRKGEEHTILAEIMKGNFVDHYETVRVRKDGTTVEVSLTVSPIHSDDGIIGASVIARDIGERKRLEQIGTELERHDFVARVAHELRTPLVTISGLAEMIQGRTQELPPERLEEIVDIVLRQGTRAQRLVDDILELSRVGTPGFRIDMGVADIRRTADETLRDFSPPEPVAVLNEIPEGLRCLADPLRLEQILGNLLSNAYRYGGANVTLNAITVADRVHVGVEDDGEGVPETLVDTVFDAFVRGKGGDEAGSGLGLSIARRMAGEMRGDVFYERRKPKGARFVVSLEPAP